MQNRAAHFDECAALSIQLDGPIGEISQVHLTRHAIASSEHKPGASDHTALVCEHKPGARNHSTAFSERRLGTSRCAEENLGDASAFWGFSSRRRAGGDGSCDTAISELKIDTQSTRQFANRKIPPLARLPSVGRILSLGTAHFAMQAAGEPRFRGNISPKQRTTPNHTPGVPAQWQANALQSGASVSRQQSFPCPQFCLL